MSVSRSALEEMVASLPIGAALLDRELRYQAVSELWSPMWRVPHELIGRHHYEVFSDLSDDWKEYIAKGLEGEEFAGDSDAYTHADGSVDYIKWKLCPWHEGNGEVGGVVIYAHIITDELETRNQLAEREAHIANLFDHSPIGLNLCTMDGTWLESNQAFLDVIGYGTKEEAKGLTYWELTPRKYDADEEVQLASLAATKRYGPYEKEFIRKDGTLVPVRLNGFIVERAGEEFIWSLIEDMSKQKDLESQLKQERLLAMQAAKLATLGEMAAGVAHELNNPLAIIQGYADLIELAQETGQPELVEEGVGAIRSAVDRSASIITGLLRFSRDSGTDKEETVTAESLIADALALTRARMENHGVELYVENSSSREIVCNAVKFSQVLVNLINNAFDAIRSLDNAWLRIEATDRGESEVEFRITDAGSGIDPTEAERIFNPFFTTKNVGDGTGLGLSISKGLIEELGGMLKLNPDFENTQFVIQIPVGANS